jgi:hypothetical protein
MSSPESIHRASFLVPALSLAGLLAMPACTATLNETPASGGDCAQDTSVVGCVGDSKGYSCSGVVRPDQRNAALSCSAGAAGAAGSTLYCCVDVAFASNTCSADVTVVGCGGTALGFSCQGDVRPDQTDSSLVCSQGAQGSGGETLYCCAPFTASASTCAQDTSVQGCGGSAVGFSCTGSIRPETVNGSLVCTAGTAAGGITPYCCDTGVPPTTTGACAVQASVVCASPATGYLCGGGATPPQGDPSLNCGTATAASSGQFAYCCDHPATTPGSCVQDASVTGCAANSVGYSCTGTATPVQPGASLTCVGPTTNNGATDYCCSSGTPPPAMCMPDASVTGCPGIATGYSCTGNASPETNSTLLCGMAMTGSGGTMTFCCTPN